MSDRRTILLSPPARRALASGLPETVAAAARELITGAVAHQPWRVGKPLQEPYEGLHVARRGTYRVVYRIDEDKHTVTIQSVKHQRDAYHGHSEESCRRSSHQINCLFRQAPTLAEPPGSCRGVNAPGQRKVAVDRARQHIKMNDGAVRVWDQISHDRDSRRIFVTSDDQRTGGDDRWIARFIEERPYIPGLIFCIEIGGDVNVDHLDRLLTRCPISPYRGFA